MSEERKERAAQIFKQFKKLQQLLDHQGEPIYKAWREFDRSQKVATLKEVRPDMPKNHRPDAEAFMKEDYKRVNAYLTPLINLEDLVVDDTLLILLSERGRTQPHEFAHADDEMAFFWKQVQGDSNIDAGKAMRLHGMTNAKSYGSLVPSSKKRKPDQVYLERGLFWPFDGLRVLEIQELILDFLVDVSEAILSQVKGASLSKAAKPEPSLPSEQVYDSLGKFSTMTSYEKPSLEHIARLNEIVNCERDSKEDEIWSMREDPGAFAERIRDELDHLWVEELDKDGEVKFLPFQSDDDNSIWAAAAEKFIKDMYMDFAFFDELLKLGQNFETLARAYDSGHWQENKIPESVAESYVRLNFLPNFFEKKQAQRIRLGVTVSPPFRDKSEIITSMAKGVGISNSQFKSLKVKKSNKKNNSAKKSKKKDDPGVVRLMELFSIFFHEKSMERFPMHVLTDALSRLVEGNSAAHDLFSSWNTVRLSDLSIIAEYRHQLDRLHPWTYKAVEEVRNAKPDEEAVDTKPDEEANRLSQLEADFLSEFGFRKPGSRWMMTDISDDAVPPLHQLADPSDGKYHYPIHEPRSQQVVEACRKAEENLANFWSKFDLRVKNSEDENYRDVVGDRLEQDRTPYRTPEWSELEVPEPSESKVSAKRAMILRMTNVPPAKRSRKTEPQDRHVQQDVADLPEQDDGPQQDFADPPEPDNNPRVPKPKFPVDQRAKVVFDALFHSPTARGRQHPGEIKWDDFKYAMSEIKFSGCKLKGSAWQFARKRDDGLGKDSFNVHEPHPSHKCSFAWMRREGRRLTRRLGWTGETFVPKIGKD